MSESSFVPAGDQDAALQDWYRSFLAPAGSDENVLTGGGIPPISRIREIFANWVHEWRPLLQRVICQDLGYGDLSQASKDIGQLAVVTAIATALQHTNVANEVDPVATAVALVTGRWVDNLCEAE